MLQKMTVNNFRAVSDKLMLTNKINKSTSSFRCLLILLIRKESTAKTGLLLTKMAIAYKQVKDGSYSFNNSKFRMRISPIINRHTFIATAPLQQTVYRRKFPKNLIALGSSKGQKMFRESLNDGNCQAFFPLIQNFITQSAPHTCGPTTMAMVLNALSIDPRANWKGIWRWYDDWNIKDFNYKDFNDRGMDMLEFHQTMRNNQADSMVFSPIETRTEINPFVVKKASLDLFRSAVLACVRRSHLFLSVNYSRADLGQTGSGHFGPIAAYHQQSDKVLFLEVAKFKYDSYWVSLEQFYRALLPFDSQTQMSRGFFINRKRKQPEQVSPAPICSIENDQRLSQLLREIASSSNDVTDCIQRILSNPVIWSALIPILYDYHCSFIDNPQEVTSDLIRQTIPSAQQSLNLLHQNEYLLADAFCLEKPKEIGQLLYLVLQLSPQLQKSVPRSEISQLVRRYQLLLGVRSPCFKHA